MKVLRRKKVLPLRVPDWDISEDEYDKIIKLIFDGVRNLLICAGVFALALYTGNKLEQPSGGYVEILLNGFGILLLSALLVQWKRKTSRQKFTNTRLFLIVAVAYVLVLPIFFLVMVLLVVKQS